MGYTLIEKTTETKRDVAGVPQRWMPKSAVRQAVIFKRDNITHSYTAWNCLQDVCLYTHQSITQNVLVCMPGASQLHFRHVVEDLLQLCRQMRAQLLQFLKQADHAAHAAGRPA